MSNQKEELYDALSEIEKISDPQSFGELIRSLRVCDGHAQAQIADELGVSKQHLSAIENGQKSVSIARAARFAEVLGYPVDQFVIAVIQDEIREYGVDPSIEIFRLLKKQD